MSSAASWRPVICSCREPSFPLASSGTVMAADKLQLVSQLARRLVNEDETRGTSWWGWDPANPRELFQAKKICWWCALLLKDLLYVKFRIEDVISLFLQLQPLVLFDISPSQRSRGLWKKVRMRKLRSPQLFCTPTAAPQETNSNFDFVQLLNKFSLFPWIYISADC